MVFAGADAQQNAQDFEISELLRKRGVQTGSPHFDESKVETCGESDRLEMGGDAFGVIAAEAATVWVSIRSRNRGVLFHIQAWHGPANGAPESKSGLVMLRYRDQKLVSMVSYMRLVRRGLPVEPVAVLPGIVAKQLRSTGLAPLDSRKLFKN